MDRFHRSSGSVNHRLLRQKSGTNTKADATQITRQQTSFPTRNEPWEARKTRKIEGREGLRSRRVENAAGVPGRKRIIGLRPRKANQTRGLETLGHDSQAGFFHQPLGAVDRNRRSRRRLLGALRPIAGFLLEGPQRQVTVFLLVLGGLPAQNHMTVTPRARPTPQPRESQHKNSNRKDEPSRDHRFRLSGHGIGLERKMRPTLEIISVGGLGAS